jgi:hypothetical protein
LFCRKKHCHLEAEAVLEGVAAGVLAAGVVVLLELDDALLLELEDAVASLREDFGLVWL